IQDKCRRARRSESVACRGRRGPRLRSNQRAVYEIVDSLLCEPSQTTGCRDVDLIARNGRIEVGDPDCIAATDAAVEDLPEPRCAERRYTAEHEQVDYHEVVVQGADHQLRVGSAARRRTVDVADSERADSEELRVGRVLPGRWLLVEDLLHRARQARLSATLQDLEGGNHVTRRRGDRQES